MPDHQFDVALSFSGKQRDYVRLTAASLKAAGANVFFDEDQQTAMWGKDLVEFFDAVFRTQSRYVVLFISRDYAESEWTRHERRSALAAQLTSDREMVLPVRFDDTELPGLPPTKHHLPLDGVTPDELAARILEKIELESEPGLPTIDNDEIGWEHLLFARELEEHVERLSGKFRVVRRRIARPSGKHVATEREALDLLQVKTSEAEMLVSNVEGLLGPSATEAAFGRSGESGNQREIKDLAADVAGIFEGLADWAIELRGTTVPSDEAREALNSLAKFAEPPVQQFCDFVTTMAQQVRTAVAQVRAGSTAEPVNVLLTVMVPDEVLTELNAAIQRLGLAVRRSEV